MQEENSLNTKRIKTRENARWLFPAGVGFIFICLLIASLEMANTPRSVTVHIRAAYQEDFQLFFDTGHGFNERQSVKRRLNPGENILRISSPDEDLDELCAIRIDVATRPTTVTVSSISIEGSFLSLKEWQANDLLNKLVYTHDVDPIRVKNNAVVITSVGDDPYLRVDFERKSHPSLWMFALAIVCFLVVTSSFRAPRKDRSLQSTFLMLEREVSPTIWLAILIFASCIVLYKKFLTLEYLYIFSTDDIAVDTIYQFWPMITHIADYFRTEGIPGWSFNVGLGQNIFPAWITDPFTWPLILLGRIYLPLGMIYVHVFKIFLAGLLFQKYLQELGISPFGATLAAYLYAFSGHIILRGTWYGYATESVLLALALYAFERYYRRDDVVTVSIATALLFAQGAFTAYHYSIVLFFFWFVRQQKRCGLSPDPLVVRIRKAALIYVFSLGIASVTLLPDIYNTITNPRAVGKFSNTSRLASAIFSFNDVRIYITSFLRAFSSDIGGTGNRYHLWWNYLESPLLYCGLLPLILIPAIALVAEKTRRWLTPLGIGAMLYLLFPYFRYALNAFSGNYFKISSLWIVVVLLLIFAHAFDALIKSDFKIWKRLILWVFALSAMLIGVSIFTQKKGYGFVDVDSLTQVLFVIALFETVLFARLRVTTARLRYLLLAVTIFEVLMFSNRTVNNRAPLHTDYLFDNKGYFDDTTNAVRFISQRDTDFYRLHKEPDSVYLADALMQGYRGTKSYQSFNSPAYLRFLDAFDLANQVPNFIDGFKNHISLNTLVGVRYFLSRSPVDFEQFSLVVSFGELGLYKLKKSRPLGFVYQHAISEQFFYSLPLEHRESIILDNAIIDTEFFENYPHQDRTRHIGLNDTPTPSSKNIVEVKEYGANHISAEVNSTGGILFFSIPYDRGWKIMVDGVSAQLHLVNLGFIGLPISSGRHYIHLDYEVPFRRTGFIISSVCSFCLIIFASRVKKRSGTTTLSQQPSTGSHD